MRLLVQAAICLSILTFWARPLYSQGADSHEALFQKLQSEQTAGEAFNRLLELGKRHADVREYLVAHLPERISAGPGSNSQVWAYETSLAGLLKIREAIPALIGQIDRELPNDIVTFSGREKLADFPAGRALAQIGEPAVPALSSILETGDYQKRWVASRALNMIDARTATEALTKHLPRESDPRLKDYIQHTLQRKQPPPPSK